MNYSFLNKSKSKAVNIDGFTSRGYLLNNRYCLEQFGIKGCYGIAVIFYTEKNKDNPTQFVEVRIVNTSTGMNVPISEKVLRNIVLLPDYTDVEIRTPVAGHPMACFHNDPHYTIQTIHHNIVCNCLESRGLAVIFGHFFQNSINTIEDYNIVYESWLSIDNAMFLLKRNVWERDKERLIHYVSEQNEKIAELNEKLTNIFSESADALNELSEKWGIEVQL